MAEEILSKSLIQSYLKSLKFVIQNYVFDLDMFKISRRNYRLEPAASPILSSIVRRTGDIPTFEWFLDEMIRRGGRVSGYEQYASEKDAMRAKVKQIYTGCLREYKVAADLNPHGVLSQDLSADIGVGRVDLCYRKWDGIKFLLAIGHDGKDSEYYKRLRKTKKEYAETRGWCFKELTAPNLGGKGLHVVPNYELVPLILGETDADESLEAS